MKKILCPLKFSVQDEMYQDVGFMCNKDKCAWWNHSLKICAVAVLALKIGWEVARS